MNKIHSNNLNTVISCNIELILAQAMKKQNYNKRKKEQ